MHFFGLSLLTLALQLVLVLAAHDKIRFNRNHEAIAKRAPSNIELHKRYSGARWSFYDAETGNAGACGRYIKNTDWAVALNIAQFGGGYPGPHCFQIITMHYNGKTAKVPILDECPGCPYGGLDLTEALFSYFAAQSIGIIYGEWEFGDGGGDPAPTTTKKTTTSVWHAPTPTVTWHPASTTPPPTTTRTPTSSSTKRASTSSSGRASTSSDSEDSTRTSTADRSTSTESLVGGTVLGDFNWIVVGIGGLILEGADAVST